MKTIITKKGNYFRDNDGYYCFYTNGNLIKTLSLQGVKIQLNIHYQLNGKRKVN